jgi:hypothetical protein
VLDHLAGQYLATLPAQAQAEAVQRFVHGPAWRDVLLALLTAQVSPHTTEPLLTAALGAGDRPWADVDGYELLADALAAGVKLTPRSQTASTNRLVERVETRPVAAPSGEPHHRARRHAGEPRRPQPPASDHETLAHRTPPRPVTDHLGAP